MSKSLALIFGAVIALSAAESFGQAQRRVLKVPTKAQKQTQSQTGKKMSQPAGSKVGAGEKQQAALVGAGLTGVTAVTEANSAQVFQELKANCGNDNFCARQIENLGETARNSDDPIVDQKVLKIAEDVLREQAVNVGMSMGQIVNKALNDNEVNPGEIAACDPRAAKGI